MKYRFVYAELVDEGKWEERASLEVNGPIILACALRALADELDPQKPKQPVHRGNY